MKCIPSNIELMNKKYASNRRQIVRDVIDAKPISKKEAISELDLEKEVYRLQNSVKKLSDDFALRRQQLQDDCREQLTSLNESTDKTRRLQNDLEQGKRWMGTNSHADLVFQNMRHYHRSTNLSNEKMRSLMNSI